MGMMKQAIVALPSGLQAILDELKAKGFDNLVKADEETGIEYLSGGIHRLYTVPNDSRDVPCVSLLLGPAKIMDKLAGIDWVNAQILAVGDRGTDLYELINSDPDIRAIYDSYIPPHMDFLTEEGVETEENTGITNPLAGQINKVLGKWA